MSLSRPATIPLLKLPFLCIECVIRSCDIFDMIIFALTSTRERQVVKILKIRLNEIRILLSYTNRIAFDRVLCKIWYFLNRGESKPLFDQQQYLREYHLVLQKHAVLLHTRKRDHSLDSYTNGNEVTALKMAMVFLN